MKKLITILMTLAMAATILSGCGNKADAPGNEEKTTTQEPTEQPQTTEAPTEQSPTDIDLSQHKSSEKVQELGLQVVEITEEVLNGERTIESAATLIDGLAALEAYKPVTTQDKDIHEIIGFISENFGYDFSYSEESTRTMLKTLKILLGLE